MADFALIIVIPEVCHAAFFLLFFFFPESKTQPCSFWRKVHDTNLYCSLSLPMRGYLMFKRCVLICFKSRRQPRGKFWEHRYSPQLIAKEAPCCGLDLTKVQKHGAERAWYPLGRAVIQSHALWNGVQAFSHSWQKHQHGLVSWSCGVACVWICAGCHLQNSDRVSFTASFYVAAVPWQGWQLCPDRDVQGCSPVSHNGLSLHC